MMTKPHCPIIAIEEHYWDEELASHYTGVEAVRDGEAFERLKDAGDWRLKEMDEAGVDVQVLSHVAPATQKLDARIATDLARRVNDRLAATVQKNSTRLAGFAALPTADPIAAADELERTVQELGFKGAMIHGHANGEFIDKKQFWPIFERAERLDVPIYIHPSWPNSMVIQAYYEDYIKQYPQLPRPAWGYTVETATQAIRLVLSGAFEAYPRLKIILGHLGEGLPYLLWRIDQALSRPGQQRLGFREVFCNNFWITTSGNFSTPALQCCIMEMGIDRVLFSVDWPFVMNVPAVRWIESVPLCDEDKTKILSGNAKRLLRM